MQSVYNRDIKCSDEMRNLMWAKTYIPWDVT